MTSKQESACVDDFGTALYRCRFTGELVGGEGATTCGANIPGVHAAYVLGTSAAAKAAKKQNDQWFHESEANCNTCSHLQRVTHEKRKDGMLLGRCTNAAKAATPYPAPQPGTILFHPDDPMQMPCYVSRWAVAQ